MNYLKIFQNDVYGEIRTTQINGEVYFVAADVCNALEISDTSKATSRLDADEKDTTLIRTPGGNQTMVVVNEYGLYALVTTSRKPEAKAFKRWIIHEVLPSIRKTGSYTLPRATAREEAMLNNSRARQAALLLRCAKETQIPLHKELLLRGAANIATGQEILPAIECNRTYSATEVAKNLGISANMVGKIANRLNLKQDGVYGNWCADTTRNLKKDVQVFRYNDKAVALIENELKRGASK